MTANEVATTLFWIVAGSYVFYLAWSVRDFAATRLERRLDGDHPPTGERHGRAAERPGR